MKLFFMTRAYKKPDRPVSIGRNVKNSVYLSNVLRIAYWLRPQFTSQARRYTVATQTSDVLTTISVPMLEKTADDNK